VGGRRRNFSRKRAIALSLFTVANQTIRLEERLAFFEHPGRSMVRIHKLSSGAGRFVFTGAVVKRTKAARDGSRHRALRREAIPGDGIWRICLVGGRAGHVRHVLVGALSWRSAAAGGNQGQPENQEHGGPPRHDSTSFSRIRSAPLSCRIRQARCTSNAVSRRRKTRANVSLVISSANNTGFFPG